MQESCSVENEGNEDEQLDALSFEQSILKITSMKGGIFGAAQMSSPRGRVGARGNIFLA